jgi:transcriptional regulator with XRE-family HTH domain
VNLGGHIRAERKARKISQESLARRAGMSLRALNSLERGEARDPHFSTLAGLAKALDMSISELLLEEPGVPLAEAPTLPEASPEEAASGEDRHFIEALARWIGYIERRARAIEQQAKLEENPYLATWQTALQWASDVSEAVLELFEGAEEAARPLMEGGEAHGVAAEELWRLERSYERLWRSESAVNRRAGEALDAFASALGDTSSLGRVRQRAKHEEARKIEEARNLNEKRRQEKIEKWQERRSA